VQIIAIEPLFLNSLSHSKISTDGQVLWSEMEFVWYSQIFLEELNFQRNLCYHASQIICPLSEEGLNGSHKSMGVKINV
jgi:hypothetical protein